MRTDTLFKDKTVFSYEIFPPRRTAPIDTIYHTLDRLKGQQPDFISVTLGAGGTGANLSTADIAQKIQDEQFLPSVAHLPAVNFSKGEIIAILEELKQKKVENILALRGDILPDKEPKKDFSYANDLVAFIQEQGDFNIIGACYPETHSDAASSVEDIRNLKRKVDSGTNQLISQLFFDNHYFYTFKEKCDIAAIEVPIQAGIMPVVNKKQIERMVKMSNVTLPTKFLKMMERYEHNPEAIRDAGIAYAINQIVDLVTQGADGIHLYTMNNPYVAQKIREATRSLFEA
ncbi:5,10-methylenetetrahydrofolate reductase [Enterococcus haemoperoxidus ATCC BAA-382]|uniref:Methylenetetrahydrofolate reductase n=1 Tax=Enterococcus haemoperoxidus ATCC BAA-382 TaxID=1158608 RepID=R2SZV9_9ENTE|nr:methylenetetrahydrofolate reductase [NAD(P)H] [Enterococcus haemoperoxidus]EOH93549.1 5,10-methylenetetrahydrofolate reductase [Enterococcus haemoperoxidus ATCC BAA-382]EOT63384.1 5,10-methylenetetrahydrofolate reductase [Enterococcus haemoperoxidus ATCC BAA-382]OJG50760.1 5,10-methylenetetrahydrofolate reductase [Enterococcus haemoperoxidus]